METVYKYKKRCCGCTSCANVCPQHAIKMCYDEDGFIYPVIDQKKCIQCGLCIKVCDFKNRKRVDRNYKPETYIFQNYDREKSQSGGAFIALSDYVLDKGGSIYGCVLDTDNNVSHFRAISKAECDKMRKSKYVQSNINGVISEISADLKEGKLVLFSGTPCQAAGIKNFFENHRCVDNLLIIDLICHGVPSPKVFKKYIQYIEKKYNGKVTDFIFRDISDVGWGGEHVESYIINGEKKYSNIWRNIFYDNVAMRECCSVCPYTTIVRNSDITIADAWQLDKHNPEMLDDIGTSLIMVHSPKGEKILKCVSHHAVYKKVDIDDYMQVNMFRPSRYSKRLRKDFLKEVNKDFGRALEEFEKRRHFNKFDALKVKISTRILKFFCRGIKREVDFFIRNRKGRQ